MTHVSSKIENTELNLYRLAFSTLVLSAVVLMAYFQALNLQFVGDDWIFIDLAGRLNLRDYLIKYFDPNAQTAWYRPVQGVLIRLGYSFLGVDPVLHHLVNVLIHLATVLTLLVVVSHALRRWQIGFIAALLFATFPIAVESVFKTGVIDPIVALAFMLSIGFWLRHLQAEQPRDYWLAFAAFTVALLSKEISVTLPVTLFLFDRFWIAKPLRWSQLVRRYLWFGVAGAIYAPIEYIVTQRSVFVHREGYTPSSPLLSNFFDYLSGLAFPWIFVPPASYVWLGIVVVALAYLILIRKRVALIPIVAGATMAFLPILPFPMVSFRFLYVSLLGSALLFALAFDWLWQRLPHNWATYFVGGSILALVTVIGSVQISQATLAFAEFGRVSRVTYRNVWQAHPTFPEDTYLYFFYPPVPGPNLSGMFFTRYGTRVTVNATDSDHPARLRDHATTFVYVFDEQGNQKELRVEKDLDAHTTTSLPVTLGDSIVLEGFELVSDQIQRGDALVLLLYWRGTRHITDDYTVIVQVVDSAGKVLTSYEKEPRRGQAPTSTWHPGELIVDAIVLPIDVIVPPGTYRLDIGLTDAARNRLLNQAGQDRIIIEPVRVGE